VRSLSDSASQQFRPHLGTVNIRTLPQNTPFLLCLADMDRLGVIFDNLNNKMIKGNLKIPLTRRRNHA